jgi:hypothetical protein
LTVSDPSTRPAIENDVVAALQSRRSGIDTRSRASSLVLHVSRTTSRSGSSYGNGFNSTPSMMLKIVVLMPIPRPRHTIPTIAKPLLRDRLRTA